MRRAASSACGTTDASPVPATQEVCELREVTLSVEAGDESGVAAVVADLAGPAGVARVALVQDGPWFLSLFPPSVVGEWTVDVVAVDGRGNRASLTTGFAVLPCSQGHTQSPLA